MVKVIFTTHNGSIDETFDSSADAKLYIAGIVKAIKETKERVDVIYFNDDISIYSDIYTFGIHKRGGDFSLKDIKEIESSFIPYRIYNVVKKATMDIYPIEKVC